MGSCGGKGWHQPNWFDGMVFQGMVQLVLLIQSVVYCLPYQAPRVGYKRGATAASHKQPIRALPFTMVVLQVRGRPCEKGGRIRAANLPRKTMKNAINSIACVNQKRPAWSLCCYRCYRFYWGARSILQIVLMTGGVHSCHAWGLSPDYTWTLDPYNGGMKHVGFSPTGQASCSPIGKHREVA